MRKTAILLFAILIFSLTFSFGVTAQEEIKVYILGEQMSFDTPPVLVNDRTMVPMRSIFEALGATVKWDEEFQRVEGLFEDGTHIMLYVGKDTAYVNGEAKKLDAAPYLKDSRTMIPLRFVAEGSDAVVDWDEETWSVHITPAYLSATYIPFGEYMNIPAPLTADPDFALLDYKKEGNRSYFKFDLTRVESDVVAKYERLLVTNGFEMVKGTIGDTEKILYNKAVVITTSIADGVYSLTLYEDRGGLTIKEYLNN